MRFDALALERYGTFTDRVLAFDRTARVTVIHGANEAGKSTALAAVADVLFGIEERTRYGFLHDYRTMRLSARIAAPDGRTLSFARLKRRNASLVDPDTDVPLGEDILVPFLGAHDRAAFLDIFGLNQERLREGGKKLLAGGGDLAETLLTAAPGLSEIAALRDRLKDEAAKIFNPDRRNASHVFYRALEQRDQARRAVRQDELRIDEVKARREEAHRAAEARQQAVEAEIAARLELSNAQALGRATRELRVLDAQRAERDALGILPAVPSGFVARAREALAALDGCRRAAERAAEEEAAARAAQAAIAVDGAVLALTEAIESCDGERAAVAKELDSLPRRQAEVDAARGGLSRIAAALGLTGIEELRAKLPGPPLLARAGKLAERLDRADERTEALRKERERLAAKARAAEDARASLGHVIDPAPLLHRFAALDGAEQRERDLRAKEQRVAAGSAQLAERVRRLGFDVADADALAALALPALDAASAALRAVNETAAAREKQADAHAQLAEQLAQAQARLAALNAGRPAPTEVAIAAARRHRDELWGRLRPLALGTRAPVPEDATGAAALDRALTEADRLADERQTETQRLSDLARTELEIAELTARLDVVTQRLAAADDRCAGAAAAWRRLWPDGIELPPGEAALALLREAEAIRQAREGLRNDVADCETAREAVRWDRAECEKLRVDLGLPPLGDAPLRMADLRAAVAELDKRFRDARERARDLKLMEQAGAELDAREREISEERAALAAEAREVFPPLAIRVEARADEARAAIELWREAVGLASDLATAEGRVAGIERDRASFIAQVSSLLQQLGEKAAADAFAAARQLRARLDAARQARSRADLAAEALAARQQALAAATSALQAAEAEIAVLVKIAGVASADQLPPVLDRLERAASCAARIAEAEARLADIRGSRSEDDIRAAIAGKDDDTLAALALEAEARHEEARIARDEAVARHTRAAAALEEIEQRTGAAAAAQREQDALADIAEAMEGFARSHVAARLLTAAIERYRQKHQSPIIERASAAFATLTGGRWSGIAVDYEHEEPRLAAVRHGRLHGVEALSEGTADQLFLALRVAAIEEHARRAAPLPFIADDLFVSFDEARTAAGLALLAELGRHTQVIVFTHHDHVAASAARNLDGAAAIIRL